MRDWVCGGGKWLVNLDIRYWEGEREEVRAGERRGIGEVIIFSRQLDKEYPLLQHGLLRYITRCLLIGYTLRDFMVGREIPH